MKYKIDMESVKALAAEDKNVSVDTRRGQRLDIFYDAETGEVWSRFQISENDWTQYHSSAVIQIAATSRGHSAEWYISKLEAELTEMLTLDPDWCEVYGVSR